MDDFGQHTEEEHMAYLDLIRNRLLELAELIRAAPCASTMLSSVRMLNILSANLDRAVSQGYRAAPDFDSDIGQPKRAISNWRFERN